MSKTALPPQDQEMTLVQHLLDLKTSLTRAVLAILLFFLILFPFANEIYTYISEPLTRFLPTGTSMIATGVASPFLTPFKLSLVLAVYLAMPVLLYQLWRFIAPALYTHERQLVGPILFFSSFLFYAGGAFAYFVVFPLVFGFLSTTAPEGVTIATDISLYLDFVIKMFFAFGMAFEVPIVTVLLILTGMASPKKLAHARPYIIVGAFVIGMLLTPPDIISQTLLAIPMWLLYEIGVIVGASVLKRRGIDQNDTENETAPSSDSGQSEGTKATQTRQSEPEYEFDDRYADQVDDDLDWDSEFDKIDSEMSILEQEYNKRQQAEKQDNDKPAGTESADKATEDSAAKSDSAEEHSENKPDDKPSK
ncbi:twin-arginine translocase subunit TatC [Thiomicrorhabdus chilensis]|uniref:twin-arginine translocase subunit TatC n=1 Tax=Thiomicrorhabdus chilensis TaxID=63656 RepID=UPI00041C358F|nr:twin-arginine translocase subunit TatC [Thiomicrorhabdus chilensis]